MNDDIKIIVHYVPDLDKSSHFRLSNEYWSACARFSAKYPKSFVFIYLIDENQNKFKRQYCFNENGWDKMMLNPVVKNIAKEIIHTKLMEDDVYQFDGRMIKKKR